MASSTALLSCRHFGFTRVDDGVYIAEPDPSLTRVGREISSARQETQGSAATGKHPELSVLVRSQAGIGPEGFIIRTEENSVRVEGGGPPGAYYGGLELARRLREGRSLAAIATGPVQPHLAHRVLKIALPLPGLSAEAWPASWVEVADRIAGARFNTLVVTAGHVFPELVRIARFPKVSSGSGVDPARRQEALRKTLETLAERHLRVIVLIDDLEPPASLWQHYSDGALDARSKQSLASTYLRECVNELLQAFPRLRGVGPTARLVQKLTPAVAADLMRGPFAEGAKAAGREVALWVPAELDLGLAEWQPPGGVELWRERRLGLRLPPDAPRATAGSKVVGAMPIDLLGSHCPDPEWIEGCLAAARKQGYAGFSVDLFTGDAAGWEARPETSREALVAEVIGLSAYAPGLDSSTWDTLWREAARDAGAPLGRAARAASAMWRELARLWPRSGWKPLTVTEASPREGDLRDAEPYVSILELVFSAVGSADAHSIVELVAGEAAGGLLAGKASPLEVAAAALGHAEACRREIAGLVPSTGAAPEGLGALLALELDLRAQLGAFHARRATAGVHLLRYIARGQFADQERARAEIRLARDCWSGAARNARTLRSAYPHCGAPDLEALSAQVELDLAMVDGAGADPFGYASSPLASPGGAQDMDYRSLVGWLHLGVGPLNTPPRELLTESQAIEAEHLFGRWRLCTEVAGYTGEGYVSSWGTESPSRVPMSLRLRAERGETIHVWVRTLIGGGAGSPAVSLRLGQGELKSSAAALDGPRRFAWTNLGTVEIAPGEALLQLRDIGPGAEGVDLIVLAREREWTPPSF